MRGRRAGRKEKKCEKALDVVQESIWCVLLMFPRQSPPTEKDPPFSLICQKLSQRLVLLGRVMKALFSLSLQGSRVFVSIGGYLGCLRLGCSYSHKAGQPELGNPDGTSHTAHEFQVVLLIADKSSDQISGCSFILSREEGVGADTCCGHSNWALDLLLFQLEENALLHAWSLCCRPGEGWGFRLPLCTSFSHFLPRASVHNCAPSGCVGGFYKDLGDLLVFQLLPSPVELPVTAGAAGTDYNIIGLLLSHHFGNKACC